MDGRYTRLGGQKSAADPGGVASGDTSGKYVRFREEPEADYDCVGPEATNGKYEPDPDYGDPDDDAGGARSGPSGQYAALDGARPKHRDGRIAVLPPLPGGSAVHRRHMSRSPETEHDLSLMENLNEESILSVLEERFMHDVIQVTSAKMTLK